MATENFSAALRAPASASSVPSIVHPMAAPGYGKRSAPDQAPRRTDDFLLLPERERYIAAFIDRLPEGAAMTVKTLARQLPRYGQQAVSTALTALSVAGYLRRIRRLAGDGDQVRWVFRTFWSRTARDNEWWTTFLAAEDGRSPSETQVSASPAPPAPAPPAVPQQPEPDPASDPAPDPAPHPGRPSPAYDALSQLGCTDPRLALSAADCATLEGLAQEWLERGATPAHLVQALTAGLPTEPIISPRGFVRRRLTDKKPPHRPTTNTTTVTPPRLLVECTKCGNPGRPEALPDGLCRTCRPGTPTPPEPAASAVAHHVHQRVDALRALTRTP
ncbi:MarR family transcriptional regulator [Streptomyces sp. NBC_01267]|uniref:MarR family transcriptional regulator n=1 Tax=Streptomyces sp. NBC_01267 TaxID=2903805 RepID=UPI002E32DCE0|nr:MarR family transcriptional regulator [Streptomyces sp. NBC_01267]